MPDAQQDETVIVRRHWNDFRKAKVLRRNLAGLRMDQISGGVNTCSPHPMVYGYMYCNQILEGELAHSCAHGPGPHEIKVVVVGVDNPRKLMRELKAEAQENDRKRYAKRTV